MVRSFQLCICFFGLVLVSCFGGCSSLQNTTVETINSGDGKYDAQIDSRVSQIIRKLKPSVVKLNVMTFYKTWHFEEGVNSAIEFKKLINDYSVFSELNTETVNGTAFYVYSDEHKAAMLSCAHVFDFPDTIRVYYDKDRKNLKSISLKERQTIYETGSADGDRLQIVALDEKTDIALLKKDLRDYESTAVPISLLPGSTEYLDWGSRVYVLGYPMGKLTLTSGMVSIDRSTNKRFLSDALFNHGISGAPVFALLDGKDNYQLIGMASSASSQSIAYVEPQSNDQELPVEIRGGFGNLVIKKRQFINYGITYSVSIEEIYTFMANNEKKLSRYGLDSNLILKLFKKRE